MNEIDIIYALIEFTVLIIKLTIKSKQINNKEFW